MSCASHLAPRGDDHRVIRLMVLNWMLGAALGIVCAALLLWLDIAGLRGLLSSPDRIVWEGLVLLFGGFAVTFGGAVCAAAVMTVAGGQDDVCGGHRAGCDCGSRL